MSPRPFLQAERLSALGVDHGLGTLASEHARVPGLHLARQVHGRDVVRVPPAARRAADALVATLPGTAVGVRTADCVPLLLADERGRGVAAVHAGWRGSALDVGGAAVAELCRAAGCEPGSLCAVIGPHIGPCCYEVDAPVREAIRDEAVFGPERRPGHWHLDLGELNRRQLVAAGVPAALIERVGGCTACAPALYASHRREPSGRRMTHFVRVPVPRARTRRRTT